MIDALPARHLTHPRDRYIGPTSTQKGFSMESNPSPELAARIDALKSRIESMAARAERRSWATLAVAGVIVIGMFAYLRYLHGVLDQFADPQVLVEFASSAVEPQLDAELNALGENLASRAPEAIEAMEKILLESPPTLASEGRRFLVSKLDSQVTELETRAYELIQGMLSTAFDAAAEKGIDLNDPTQVKKLIEEAMPLVREELAVKVNDLYRGYAAGSDSVGEFVDRLATASDLSPLEKEQREVLITGLALMRKLEVDPSQGPLQGVLGDLLAE